MGKIMGARAQMFTADLTHNGSGNRGQIIIRSQAIQQSNEAVKMEIRLQNVNNVTGGCAGMCSEPQNYHLQIQKNVPGTDNFVTCFRHERSFRDRNPNLGPSFNVHMTALCNGNPDARIRFALVGQNGQSFNYFESTVNQIRGGQMTLDGHAGTTLIFNRFEIFIQPTFVDYLRSGW